MFIILPTKRIDKKAKGILNINFIEDNKKTIEVIYYIGIAPKNSTKMLHAIDN